MESTFVAYHRFAGLAQSNCNAMLLRNGLLTKALTNEPQSGLQEMAITIHIYMYYIYMYALYILIYVLYIYMHVYMHEVPVYVDIYVCMIYICMII